MKQEQQRGFSLIELMVVIAILGILTTVVAVNAVGNTYKAQVVKVKADFSAIRDAIDLFRIDCHRYPRSLDELVAAPPDVTAWSGPYLRLRAVPIDPWNHAYEYRLSGGGGAPYDLVCFGTDGIAGGEGEAKDLTVAILDGGPTLGD